MKRIEATYQAPYLAHATMEPPNCTAQVADGRVRLAVTDTGVGMTPQQIERLFQPFSQIDSSTTRAFGGSGLGLAIVTRLAERYGGKCSLEDGPDGRVLLLDDATPPAADPLNGAVATPSMKATRKYFFAVAGLLLLQIAMGVITAHYAVEGNSFFGLPIGELLPYVTSRTIHTQVGVFWIATAWLATGLYVGPAVSGVEPRGQAALVTAPLNSLTATACSPSFVRSVA